MKKILIGVGVAVVALMVLSVALALFSGDTETTSSISVEEQTEPQEEEPQEEVAEEPQEETQEKEYPDTFGNVDSYSFRESVSNDNTGNWRLCTISSADTVDNYIDDYVKGFFKDDSEIHAVVNLGLKTTTRIKKSGDMVFATVFEYVDGEEHDANLLFSGMLLTDYIYHMDTGELETLE